MFSECFVDEDILILGWEGGGGGEVGEEVGEEVGCS